MEILTLNQISPDQVIIWQWGFIIINATLVYTWLVMGLLVFISWIATRNITTDVNISRWQGLLESVVSAIREQIRETSQGEPDEYVSFIGTLFLFIGLSNFLMFVPGYVAPTASLTTTCALAICVFVSVPLYGIKNVGIKHYLKEYFQPTFIFLPFHIMGEITRTLALMIRLFGNMMSHDKVIGILLAVTPFLFPVVMQALGLLIGMVQAYIFAVLATVYIASASQVQDEKHQAIPAQV